MVKKFVEVTFLPFIQVPNSAISIRTGPGTSLCSLSRLSLWRGPHSLFLLDHSQTWPGISPWAVGQARASSWSGGSVQTQDCYIQSCSCQSWIFYGSFTVRWGPILGPKKSCILLGSKKKATSWPKTNHTTSWAKKVTHPLGQKKIMQPLWLKFKIRNLSGKKKSRKISCQKKSCNLFTQNQSNQGHSKPIRAL